MAYLVFEPFRFLSALGVSDLGFSFLEKLLLFLPSYPARKKGAFELFVIILPSAHLLAFAKLIG